MFPKYLDRMIDLQAGRTLPGERVPLAINGYRRGTGESMECPIGTEIVCDSVTVDADRAIVRGRLV